MQGRPHAERLRFDMNEVRQELTGTVKELASDLDWAPGPNTRSAKQLLQEIGSMELLSRSWAERQEMPDWNTAWQSFDGDTADAILSALARTRAETLAFLDRCSEDQLETPIPLPEDWREYFGGATTIEPEELLRWVVRHEYYHLGQLNIYSFLRGTGTSSGA